MSKPELSHKELEFELAKLKALLINQLQVSGVEIEKFAAELEQRKKGEKDRDETTDRYIQENKDEQKDLNQCIAEILSAAAKTPPAELAVLRQNLEKLNLSPSQTESLVRSSAGQIELFMHLANIHAFVSNKGVIQALTQLHGFAQRLQTQTVMAQQSFPQQQAQVSAATPAVQQSQPQQQAEAVEQADTSPETPKEFVNQVNLFLEDHMALVKGFIGGHQHRQNLHDWQTPVPMPTYFRANYDEELDKLLSVLGMFSRFGGRHGVNLNALNTVTHLHAGMIEAGYAKINDPAFGVGR